MMRLRRLEKQCAEIDRTTGNIDECCRILKKAVLEGLDAAKDLFNLYKQYWILVYEKDLELENLEDCLSIPEEERAEIVLSNIDKLPKRVSLFAGPIISHYMESMEDSDLVKTYTSFKHIKNRKQILFKKIQESKDPLVFFDLDETLEDFDPSLKGDHLKVMIKLSSPLVMPQWLELFKTEMKDFQYYNILNEFSAELSTNLRTGKPINDILSYTVNLDNFTIIIYILRHFGIDLESECSFYALKNSLLVYLAPPFVSHQPVPLETISLISKMKDNEKQSLKTFVFSKMLGVDVQIKLGKILEKYGVECTDEIKLADMKLRSIHLLNEDLQVELLQARSIEEVKTIIQPFIIIPIN